MCKWPSGVRWLKPHSKEETVAITEDLLDQLIKDYKKPEDLLGENGLLKQLTKRLIMFEERLPNF